MSLSSKMTRCNYDFNSSTDSQFTENEDDLDDITFLEVSIYKLVAIHLKDGSFYCIPSYGYCYKAIPIAPIFFKGRFDFT